MIKILQKKVELGRKWHNKYGTVQELRSTFSHIKSINIDFSLVWFVSLFVDLPVRM